MAATQLDRDQGLRGLRAQERREYRVLYAVTFLIVLIVALVARMLPRAWDPLSSDTDERRSVFAEARAAASTTVGFAFMR